MKKQHESRFISFLEACAIPALFIILLAIANHTAPIEIWMENFFTPKR